MQQQIPKELILRFMIVCCAFFLFMLGRYSVHSDVPSDVQRDTITERCVIHDTIVEVKPYEVVRRDTMIVEHFRDSTKKVTDTLYIDVPIERHIYQTENYKAVVEGWHSSLVGIEIYQRNSYITKTISKRKHWGGSCGLQVGYGLTSRGVGAYSGVGFTIGYSF